jgi:hypothetical protein
MARPSSFLRWKRAAYGAARLLAISAGLGRRRRAKHFLGAVAVMHNEGHILREWVETHRREGVEHFYLIDHQSTDNWRSGIADQIADGLVTIIPALGPNHNDLRSELAWIAARECEWLLIIDVDEFTYSRTEATIAQHLRSLPERVAQVKIPWLMFGTAGNEAQPRSVVKHCRLREDLQAPESPPWLVKSAIRTSRLLVVKIHGHAVAGDSVAPLPGWPAVDAGPHLPDCLKSREAELLLVQNHYNIQSREQFREKARRTGYTLGKDSAGIKYSKEYLRRHEERCKITRDNFLYLRHQPLYDGIDAAISSNLGSHT